METNYTEKIQKAQTAQERLNLLHEFIADLIAFKTLVKPDKEDEDNLGLIGTVLSFGASEKFIKVFSDISTIDGALCEWEDVNERILPSKIEENDLFLLRYAKIIAYLENGFLNYDTKDEFFYKLYSICLIGVRELNDIYRNLNNEEYFVKQLNTDFNKQLDEMLSDKYKEELKKSTEDFKKNYSKKVQDFCPRDFVFVENKLNELNRQMEKCRAKHKTYNDWNNIPLVNIVLRFLISKNRNEFSKAQQEYRNTEETLMNYKDQAKKARIADFEQAVKDFTVQKELEIKQEIEKYRFIIDMDKVRPIWKNLKKHKETFFACVHAIAHTIEQIKKNDLHMIPCNFFGVDGHSILTKHLPNYIMSGKAATLQEAVERYYFEFCR